MGQRRLSMRKVKQLLRLKWENGMSNRQIAKALKVGRETVREYLKRAEAAGFRSWTDVEGISEERLEGMLFPCDSSSSSGGYRLPDWQRVHKELSRPGVTIRLLWKEYMEQSPETAYGYSQFCNLYRQWRKELPVSMVQVYRGGEYMFVDYAGKSISYTDPLTGEVKKVQVFVTALGASSYTYVEAQTGQDKRNWIRGHINAFKYIGGVPAILVPDNLKSGVLKPSYYEPELNPLYEQLSLHYGFAVIPARVRRPRDKAKVEAAVQVVERWILAPLRNRQFFSIDEINEAIGPLLLELNGRVMKHIGKSRKELFEELDAPNLKPLPAYEFEYAEMKEARVGINYHVRFNRHYYSVPYELSGKRVEIRATEKTVEIFYKGERVASHLRDDGPGRYTTCSEHMPSSHKKRKEKWTPERFIRWATTIGANTRIVISMVLEGVRHPEQGYRACMGILKFSDQYGKERLEKACAIALEHNMAGYRIISNILKNNMDMVESTTEPATSSPHSNLRGPEYYK